MDPTLATVVTVFSTAVAAIFGALIAAYRSQITYLEKALEQEQNRHDLTRRDDAVAIRENTSVLKDVSRQLSDVVQALPKRRDDR